MSSSPREKRNGRHRGRRPARSRSQRTTILLLLQGEVTEKQYFERLKAEKKWGSVRMETYSKNPTQLVERAIKRVSSGDFDQVIAVSDVDEYTAEDFRNAIVKARRFKDGSKVRLVVSNPSFEIWLAAHYRKIPESYSGVAMKKLLQEKGALTSGRGGGEPKHISSNFPISSFEQAGGNSRKMKVNEHGLANATAIPTMLTILDSEAP